MKPKIIPKDKEHLKRLIKQEIALNGENCDLNHIDVSQIKVMTYLFDNSDFNGDISQWDVSKVNNMNNMFRCAKFNGDISNWNVSKVKRMSYMFENSKFNGDISKWKVSSVEEMSFMFLEAEFNQDISMWKPLKLKNIVHMFLACPAPPPYWSQIEDQEQRINAIKKHILHNKLSKQLNSQPEAKRKNKI